MDSPLFTRFLPFLDNICIHRNSRDVADVAPFFVYLLLHSRGQLHFDDQCTLLLQGPAFEQAFGTHAQDVRRAVEMLWDPTFPREREKLRHIQTLLHTAGDTAIEVLRTVYLDAAKAVLAVPAAELLQALPDLWMEILSELRAKDYDVDMRNPRCYVPHVRSTFLSLALHIYPPKEDDRVYIPFAAPEEYIPMLSKQQVVAQDALPLRWAIGTLTLLAQGYWGFSYRLESSAMAWQDTGDFDLLLLTASQYKLDYPSAQAIGGYLGYRVSGDGRNHPPHYEYLRYGKHVQQYLMERAFSALNEHGRAVVVLPAHFLWQQDGDHTLQAGYWESVRRRLIAQDLLDIAILLPQDGFGAYCLIGLQKKKERPGYFRLMDTQTYIKEKDRTEYLRLRDPRFFVKDNTYTLHHLHILRKLEQGESQDLAVVPLGHVQQEDYRLTPMRYFWRQQIPAELQGYPLRPLSDFMEPIKLASRNVLESWKGQEIKYITDHSIRDYVRTVVWASQVKATVNEFEPYVHKVSIADRSCLLLDVCGSSAQAVMFKFDLAKDEQPIYLHKLEAYSVEGIILHDYLVWALKQSFVSAQIGIHKSEGVRNLLDVLIPFPPLEVQEAKGMPGKNTYLV